IAALNILLQEQFYKNQEDTTLNFVEQIRSFIQEKKYKVQIFTIGSIFWFAFTDRTRITRADQIDANSMTKYKIMHRALLNQGVYFGPSGYEVGFISSAHTEQDLATTISAIKVALDIVFQ
ncbi:MAG: glutamate-1-semialdehyde 2,1-aminomutase, partial [Sphingobacterium sp.]